MFIHGIDIFFRIPVEEGNDYCHLTGIILANVQHHNESHSSVCCLF